jgi:hypothetical protein
LGDKSTDKETKGKLNLKRQCVVVDWIHPAQDGDQWQGPVITVIIRVAQKAGVLEQLTKHYLFKRGSTPWS